MNAVGNIGFAPPSSLGQEFQAAFHKAQSPQELSHGHSVVQLQQDMQTLGQTLKNQSMRRPPPDVAPHGLIHELTLLEQEVEALRQVSQALAEHLQPFLSPEPATQNVSAVCRPPMPAGLAPFEQRLMDIRWTLVDFTKALILLRERISLG